jgi:hypothetical protein
MLQPAGMAGTLAMPQHSLQQQQQQQLAEAAKKRKRADSYLLPPPDGALSLEQVIGRQRMGNDGMAAAAAAAPGAGTDGPALSVDEILRRPEYQRGAAAAAAAAGKPGPGGAAGLKAGRGRDGRRDDESRVLPESQLRRLMELQGLNKVRGSTCGCAVSRMANAAPAAVLQADWPMQHLWLCCKQTGQCRSITQVA